MKKGHVGSKATSQGQILKEPCVRSRSLIFILMLMKLGQNDCLNKISEVFDSGSSQAKYKVTTKKIIVISRVPIFSPMPMKLCQKICLNKISDVFENGSRQVKK